MKKIIFTSCLSLIGFMIQAQQTQGRVVYDRVAQMRFNIAEMGNGEQEQVRTRTDKFELTFGNDQSLWKQQEKENEDDGNINNDGIQIRMVVAGSDDVLYNNFSEKKRTELRVFMDKKFVIDDSIRPLKWKLGEETKTILNHICKKATATTVNPSVRMNVNNGVMERTEVMDTINLTAWFAADIPVAAGPAEYQGQLPGLILALDINNGRQVYKAVEISEKADLASIKAPTGKKHYSPTEFRKERDKMMQEMNSSGGRQQIRLN